MELDPKILEQIKNMDQTELSNKINEISGLLGVDPTLIKRLVGDPDQLRRKLGSLSDEDIRRMSRNIDPKKLDRIKENMNREV